MRSQLSYFEKVAGAFLGVALLGMVAIFIAIGLHKGWFEPRVYFHSVIDDSEGLREGSPVQLAGVRVGEVRRIELTENNKLRVEFFVLKRFRDRMVEGTFVQLVRPFVIGEKALYLLPPAEKRQQIAEFSLVPAQDVVGLTDLLNGRKFLPYVQTLTSVFEELREIADVLLKNKDSKRMAKLLETLPSFVGQMNLLTKELTQVAVQVNDGGNLRKVVRGLASASEALSKSMPELATSAPQLSKDLATIVTNLAVMTEEFRKVLPAFAEVAPDLPKTSHRLVEAVDEAVVVLKAMQKSFLLRGSAREVREEEAEAKKGPPETSGRVPASEPNQ